MEPSTTHKVDFSGSFNLSVDGWLVVWVYGISTFVVFLTPNPFL